MPEVDCILKHAIDVANEVVDPRLHLQLAKTRTAYTNRTTLMASVTGILDGAMGMAGFGWALASDRGHPAAMSFTDPRFNTPNPKPHVVRAHSTSSVMFPPDADACRTGVR